MSALHIHLVWRRCQLTSSTSQVSKGEHSEIHIRILFSTVLKDYSGLPVYMCTYIPVNRLSLAGIPEKYIYTGNANFQLISKT